MMERFLRSDVFGPVAIFALALTIRVAILDSQGLWADEIFSLAIATGHSLEHPAEIADPSRGDFVEGPISRPASEWKAYLEHAPEPQSLSEVVRAARLSDTNPPLYYILLHYWTLVFGTEDRALKGFSIFFSLAAFPFIASLARRIGGQVAVLPACALYALAPACLYYSTEGRMYSLCWFWVVATAFATLQWGQGTRPRISALAWVVLSAAGLYSHYFFSMVWSVFLIWMLISPGRAGRTAIVGASVTVVILAAPWYFFIGDHMSAWRVTSGWLEMKPRDWWFPDAVVKGFLGHLSGQGIWGGRRLDNYFTLVLVTVCFLTFILRWRARAFWETRGLIWMWAAAPVAGIVLLDAWQGTYALANYRYVSMGLPAIVLIVATAMAQWPNWLRWAGLAVVLTLWTPRVATIDRLPTRCNSPFREVGSALSERVHSGGVLIAHSIPSGVLGIARYSRPDLEIAAWVEQLGVREDSDLEMILEGHDQVVLARVHEVWENNRVDKLMERIATPIADDWRGSFRLLEYHLEKGPVESTSNHPEE